MVANILPADPPPYTPTLWMGLVGQNSLFQNMVMLHIKFKENQECTNMVANSFRTTDPLPVLWMGSVGHNSFFFSEHSHVTYQIKKNQECTNMVANILLADPLPHPPPPHPRDGVSRSKHFFKNKDMLHIKLKKITNAATW